jgi:predicted transcriptional regulator
MAPSVRIDEQTKSRLEQLQAEIRSRTGTQVTEEELLSRLVERAFESKADLVDSFRDSSIPLSESDKAAFNEGMISSEASTTEDDVDDVIY